MSKNKFSKKDLISFGQYLLSDERKKALKSNETEIPYKERKVNVTHADFENWKRKEVATGIVNIIKSAIDKQKATEYESGGIATTNDEQAEYGICQKDCQKSIITTNNEIGCCKDYDILTGMLDKEYKVCRRTLFVCSKE